MEEKHKEPSELTIGMMAQRCGLTAHTLRYYERIGLIQSVARGTDGHRRYSTQDVDWIAFINRMKATGMSIQSMLEFAAWRRQGDSSIPQRRELLERHTEDVRAHIQELEAALAVLVDKIAFYRNSESSMTSLNSTKGSSHGKPLQPRPAKTQRN
jgi:DNA-binding transcriptional MerR regulator